MLITFFYAGTPIPFSLYIVAMKIEKFFSKYKWLVNQSRIERKAGVPVNTISHATSSDRRPIELAYRSMIIKELAKMHTDLTECLLANGSSGAFVNLKKSR